MSRSLRRLPFLLGACTAAGCLPEELAPHWLADAQRLTNQEVSSIELFLTRVEDGTGGEQRYTAHLDYVDTEDAAWGQLAWCRLECDRDEPYPVQVFLEGSTETAVVAWGEGDADWESPHLRGNAQSGSMQLVWVGRRVDRHLVPFEATFEPAP